MAPKTVSIVRDVPPIELTECLKWLLPSVSHQRALWIISQLTDRVSQQKTSIHAVESRHQGQIQAAAIAISQALTGATLLAIHEASGVTGDREQEEARVVSAVMDRLLSRLRTAGARFLQVSAENREPGPKFESLGFRWIADLVFLVLESNQWDQIPHPESVAPCIFRIVGDDSRLHEVACRIARESFAETQDCPLLSEFRSAEEIVNGYTASATFDPKLWRILFLDGVPVGCLFLTAHAATVQGEPAEDAITGDDADPTPPPRGSLEISYMGVIPEHRGLGLGGQLLAEAVRIARHRNVERMVLAVDQQNRPAISLYHRHGWVQAAGESVWGMKILP